MKANTFQAEYAIKATAADCWHAWTNAEKLTTWLCESSSLQLEPGGDFVVSSIFPGVSGRHRIDELASEQSISFTWYVRGVATKLSIQFHPTDHGTKLRITHELPNTPPRGCYQASAHHADQLWEITLSRLRSQLEDGDSGVNFSPNDNDQLIELRTIINASPEEVWSALTQIEHLKKWQSLVMGTPIVEAKVGGRYSFGWSDEKDGGDGPGTITDFDIEKRLSMTWFGASPSLVSWELKEPVGKCTELTFLHSKLPNYGTGEIWSYRLGWASSLFSLKWYLEKGENHSLWITSQKDIR